MIAPTLPQRDTERRKSEAIKVDKGELTSCAEAAAKAKKDQRCAITVSAPAQQ